MPDRRHSDDPDPAPDAEVQAARLAELVSELTGSTQGTALHAVRSERQTRRHRDALELVAGAMVNVDQPPPDGFRLAGYLRDDGGTDDA
jgi:hypothetical protein